jgi:hypothetical protein
MNNTPNKTDETGLLAPVAIGTTVLIVAIDFFLFLLAFCLPPGVHYPQR